MVFIDITALAAVFGAGICSFGLRVEFCAMFLSSFIPFWPDFGRISEVTDVQCRDLAAQRMLFMTCTALAGSFARPLCSFGLRVEFFAQLIYPLLARFVAKKCHFQEHQHGF